MKMKGCCTSDCFKARFEYTVDLIRIYLGFGLLIRGILYIGSDGRAILFDQINAMPFSWAIPFLIAHYIIMVHTVGGLFLIFGILSRPVAILQIPILTGAVFFVHFNEELLGGGQGLEFSLLVLILLILVAFAGPGRLSMDVSVFKRVPRAG